MTNTSGNELAKAECRTVRRLGRLFRIERTGRFDSRRGEAMQRLIGRRQQLVDELIRLDAARRELAIPAAPELGAAIGDLAREVERSRTWCVVQMEALSGEIRQLESATRTATGLRDSADGRLLGSG